MKFGIQFFPDVSPSQKAAADYFTDCLDIAEAADQLGYSHIRTVEHHFHPYGGYSPNPIVFLSAAAQRARRARLVTGAVLPVFNNPLRLAGEIAMLDAICGGRLDVGFARAFLPHEFRRFGISPNESVARFREGIEQIDLLLTQENVDHSGKFHSIRNTTVYPRPTQQPRPPVYIAALSTPESFEFAGKMGYSVMAIPLAAEKMRDLISIYRNARRASGHSGNGNVMLAFHMFCHEDGDTARMIAENPLNNYLSSIGEAACDWTEGLSSTDYPGYDKIIGQLKSASMEKMIQNNSAWIGSPQEIAEMVRSFAGDVAFEEASLQVNFNLLPQQGALRSLDLFAKKVMPEFG
jgi:alkanesulfonate monooxygenase SsuD/methylene tetrahydromethanopterin reductase-like flavin-dependent oxidoreductase (luciferase family)